MKNETKNPWTTVSSKEVYDNAWIRVMEDQVLNPSGNNGIYGNVHFKNYAIGIIALDDALNIYLVGQFRYPLNAWSWEIPEGGGTLGSSILESAKRELKEETGLSAMYWEEILHSHLSNSVSDEQGFVFLAKGLHQGEPNFEETERGMKIWRLPFAEALSMVMKGAITDSLSVMGILKTKQLLVTQ